MAKHIDANQAYRSMALSLAIYGRVKIVAGASDTFIGEAHAVLPITADFSYGAGCEADNGDAPAAAETVDERFYDIWPAKKVVAGTGSAYVYLSKRAD